MAFNSLLKNIISKAVKEYTDEASIDPEQLECKGTVRDELLDQVLKEQEEQRKELWNRYYQLKEQLKERGDDKVFEEEGKDHDTQMVLGLMKTDHLLTEEIQQKTEVMDLVDRPSEVEIELKFRDELQASITQYTFALKHLKQEQHKLTKELESEKRRLERLEELYSKLNVVQERVNSASGIRNRIRELEASFKDDTNDLMDFLNENFPPHFVDGSEHALGESSSMLEVLEDLMNKAVQAPSDPYINLVPGTYWTPHVQTLIQAGVAEYHLEDASRIRLVDFSL